MAAPGTDAAEGDEGRSTAQPARATGWRVPSTDRSESGLPAAWSDFSPAPAAPIVARPLPTEADDGEPGASNAAPTRRRRWSLRRKDREPEPFDSDAPADIDLVALGADDDQAWTDLALAALEDPGTTDGDAEMLGIIASGPSPSAGNDPWSVLADELQEPETHQFAEPAPGGTESTALELEAEFWA